MARRSDHRRDVLEREVYHQREVQGEATSADTPDGERAHRGRREGFAPSQLYFLASGISDIYLQLITV